MKSLMSIKSLLIILSLTFAQAAFSYEPQMLLLNGTPEKAVKTTEKELAQYEINNDEMIQLYAFKKEKKQAQKVKMFKNQIWAKNTLIKNAILL